MLHLKYLFFSFSGMPVNELSLVLVAEYMIAINEIYIFYILSGRNKNDAG